MFAVHLSAAIKITYHGRYCTGTNPTCLPLHFCIFYFSLTITSPQGPSPASLWLFKCQLCFLFPPPSPRSCPPTFCSRTGTVLNSAECSAVLCITTNCIVTTRRAVQYRPLKSQWNRPVKIIIISSIKLNPIEYKRDH